MACATMNEFGTNGDAAGSACNLPPPIYMIASSKGGVGKSMLAHGVLDQLQLAGKPCLFFESDTSNPDVFQCFEGVAGVTLYTVRLEDEESWADMVNAIEAHPDHVVVIGTASRTTEAIRVHGPILRETLSALQRKLVTLWVIDEQRDSLAQLKDHLRVFPDNETHVIQNSKNGPEAFSLYAQSKLRTTIEVEKGGLSRYMPRLASSICTKVYSDRMCFAKALQALPLGNRFLLIKFRQELREMLAPILGLP